MAAIDNLTEVVNAAIAVMDAADAIVSHPVVANSDDVQLQALADNLKFHVDKLQADVTAVASPVASV